MTNSEIANDLDQIEIALQNNENLYQNGQIDENDYQYYQSQLMKKYNEVCRNKEPDYNSKAAITAYFNYDNTKKSETAIQDSDDENLFPAPAYQGELDEFPQKVIEIDEKGHQHILSNLSMKN